ncbi:helix-turn-helix transcriptional regulator [Aquibacillus saliphilus]|uniref:helix-turn-helix transcriptional regulator n=1 Tax=Aquibacillus saliphilus TaxID=1909422 RepID=UPI001CF00E95|nr:helix-turn-helix transcriptional regulator [Aquibacillus saliphilus]
MKQYVYSKLDDYLKSINKNQSWLAKELKVNKSTVYRWCKNDESGQATNTPNVLYLIKLLRVLDCTVEEIFELIE